MKQHRHKQDSNSLGLYGKCHIFAGILHLFSVQPLFFAFATTIAVLSGVAVVALIPTFMCYIMFISVDKQSAPLIIEASQKVNCEQDT